MPSIEIENKRSEPIKKHRNVIVDTGEFPTTKPEGTVVTCSSLGKLKKVADALLKPVLHQAEDHKHTYWVNDGLVRYEYTSKLEVTGGWDEFQEHVRGETEEKVRKAREGMKR